MAFIKKGKDNRKTKSFENEIKQLFSLKYEHVLSIETDIIRRYQCMCSEVEQIQSFLEAHFQNQ